MRYIRIDTEAINDWASFHKVFADAFGFPDFYGNNMDAWIDCMTRLDDEFNSVRVEPGELVTLQLENIKSLKQRCPEQHTKLIECAAFVNWRRIDVGEPPILVLSFNK